ncbi:MAG: glycosyltransferase, partial [Alphaproteobacteria bacterium]
MAKNLPCFARIVWHVLADAGRIEQVLCLEGSRLLRSLLPDASFVHIHGVWEPILKQAALTARRNRVPYCVQPHGMLDAWSMKQKRLKKTLALHLGYRTMLNGAKFLLALNADEARLLEPLKLAAPKRIIPNGIFLEEFADWPAKGFLARSMPELEGKRIVLFLSRLHAKKGLDLLVQAFARLAASHPDVDLVIAGPDGGERHKLAALIGRLDLAGRAHLIGPVYGEDKFKLLADADCFCLPSHQEGFSVAITEALAGGLPVVISQGCHFPEVQTAQAGMVVSLDPAEIASALAHVLDNPAVARGMGRNGQRLVRENYT